MGIGIGKTKSPRRQGTRHERYATPRHMRRAEARAEAKGKKFAPTTTENKAAKFYKNYRK